MPVDPHLADKVAEVGIRASGTSRLATADAARTTSLQAMAAAVRRQMTQALTIVVIERRALIRECLVRCLRSASDTYLVVGCATVIEWQKAATNHASAAIIILSAQDGHDAHTMRDLSLLAHDRSNIPVIVLSDEENAHHILAALKRGARGYISTSMSLDIAVEAMRLVESGGTFVPGSDEGQPGARASH